MSPDMFGIIKYVCLLSVKMRAIIHRMVLD